MGKPKKKNPKAVKLARRKGLLKDNDESKYSIDEILDKAVEFIDQYNYEMGQKFCQRALEMNPDNARGLELSATLLIEGGNIENAKHCLGRAITIEPDSGHDKYLSLAQLFNGNESLDLYNKGISIMDMELTKEDATEERKEEIRRQLSNAFCSVAELFMTDLCDVAEAEVQCQNNIDKAVETDSHNPEGWQAKARFEAIKLDFESAKTSMKKSLSCWLPKYQSVLENKASAADIDPVETCPLLYTTRISTSKLLIELDMWDEATDVLEGLLEEDDEVVDTWYLLGWVNYLRATNPEGEEGYMGNAQYYMDKALQTQKINPTEDEDMIAHINEIVAEIGKPEEDVEAGDEKNWEDYESSDEEPEQMEQ